MLKFAVGQCCKRGETRLGLAEGMGNRHAWRLYERRGFVLVPGSADRLTVLAREVSGRKFEEHEDCGYLVREVM